MLIFSSGMILLLVLVEQSTQISFSNAMHSVMTPSTSPFLSPLPTSSLFSPSSPPPSSSSSTANGTHQAGCIKTYGPCLKHPAKTMATCAIDRTLTNLDCAIASNATWRFNEYITVKKNLDWHPIDYERRTEPEILSTFLNKLLDLFTSRSIQFTLPDSDLSPEGRMKTFGFSDLTSFTDISGPVGKRKSD